MNNQKLKRSPLFKEIFKDKNGFYNMREISTGLFLLMVVVSWIAQQFFGFELPEYMFYGFISLVGAGGFGYSIERKQKNHFTEEENTNEIKPE